MSLDLHYIIWLAHIFFITLLNPDKYEQIHISQTEVMTPKDTIWACTSVLTNVQEHQYGRHVMRASQQEYTVAALLSRSSSIWTSIDLNAVAPFVRLSPLPWRGVRMQSSLWRRWEGGGQRMNKAISSSAGSANSSYLMSHLLWDQYILTSGSGFDLLSLLIAAWSVINNSHSSYPPHQGHPPPSQPAAMCFVPALWNESPGLRSQVSAEAPSVETAVDWWPVNANASVLRVQGCCLISLSTPKYSVLFLKACPFCNLEQTEKKYLVYSPFVGCVSRSHGKRAWSRCPGMGTPGWKSQRSCELKAGWQLFSLLQPLVLPTAALGPSSPFRTCILHWRILFPFPKTNRKILKSKEFLVAEISTQELHNISLDFVKCN